MTSNYPPQNRHLLATRESSQVAAEIELVCFDVGRVLVHIQPSFAAGVAAAGLLLKAATTEIDSLFALSDDIQESYLTGTISFRDYCSEVSRSFKYLYSPEEIRLVTEGWVCAPYDGIDALLKSLSERTDVKTAVLTNTCLEHWSMIQRMAWMQYIDFSFPSHLLALSKPATAIYRRVESATGTRPDRILFFDDRSENIHAATERGWHTVHITTEVEVSVQLAKALRVFSLL